MPKQNVLIIEDDPLVAASIKLALEKLDFNVEAVAHSYLQAKNIIDTLNPDIAFVDINLNGNYYGLQIAEMIYNKKKFPYIFLTAYANREILEKAKKYQPAGYIIKPFDENDLLANIEIALYNHAQRQNSLHPKLNWSVINKHLHSPISDREIEVMTEVINGKTNQQIAKDLFLSVATIKSHLSRIYSKLDVHSRTGAIAALRKLSRRP